MSEKSEKQEKLEEVYRSHVRELILKEDIRYIASINRYSRKSEGSSDYIFITDVAIRNLYRQVLNFKGCMTFLNDELSSMKRMYANIVYTWKNNDPWALNLLNRKQWILPKSGEYNPMFDVLMTSLGGGKQENIDHLEHCIAWKYLHPEDHQIPCIVFYPEGGVGKNVLVDVVLNRIFGKQTVSAKGQNIFGTFNSVVKGKAVVYIDELTREKASMEKLKHLVSQPYIEVNEKYMPITVVDNTAMYIIGSNDINGPITLAGDGSDRRWSVINVPRKKDLGYWIENKLGLTDFDVTSMVEQMNDDTELSHWLYHILDKWRDSGRPKALHGEDYHVLVDAQRPESMKLLDQIIGQDDFTYISFNQLWLIYKLTLQINDPGGLRFTRKGLFKAQVLDYIARYHPEVEFRGSRGDRGVLGINKENGRKTTVEAIARSDIRGSVDEVKTYLSLIEDLSEQLAHPV